MALELAVYSRAERGRACRMSALDCRVETGQVMWSVMDGARVTTDASRDGVGSRWCLVDRHGLRNRRKPWGRGIPVGWDADSSAAQACMLCRDLSSIRTAVRSHVLH